ncbi:MAG TPA: hypothetical protein VFG83_14835 [Kofleriaceae bacterium]|nr:hypothetical protein [Kofleriaceae bacterium]
MRYIHRIAPAALMAAAGCLSTPPAPAAGDGPNGTIDAAVPDAGNPVDAPTDARVFHPDGPIDGAPPFICPIIGYPPSNIDCAEITDPSESDFEIFGGDSVSIDTDDPASCPSELSCTMVLQVQSQTPVMVATARSFQIDDGGRLFVSGSAPLVLLVATTVTIDGTLFVAPRGPGISTVCDPGSGESGDGDPIDDGPGGGGGGFGSAGGEGGNGCISSNPDCADVDRIRLAGGQEVGEASLVPLRGGCPGGSGGAGGDSGNTGFGGDGGNGGSAIQISAGDEINIFGDVIAPGGGGDGAQDGNAGSCGNGGGGGGGAGGGILLEAPIVGGQGVLDARGGGGGAGCDDGQANSDRDGQVDGQGGFAADNAGGGGDGAFADQPAGAGGTTAGAGGGGGGGGLGRVRINACVSNTGEISGSFSTGQLPGVCQ